MRGLVVGLLLLIAGRASASPLVWCFGDSITGHYGPLLAADHPEWNVVVHWKGGEHSDEAAVRLQGLLDTEPPPDVVVLETGTNDMLAYTVFADPTNHSPAEAAARIAAMRDLLTARGIAVIVATPVGTLHPRREYGLPRYGYLVYGRALAQLRALLRRMSPMVSFRISSDRLYADFVHPNAQGDEILAGRAARALIRAGF